MIHLDESWVRGAVPRRPADAHKGGFGTLSIVGGSGRYRGAALLAAEGALRAGAGIVRLAAVEAVCAAAAVRLPGCTLLPMPHTPAGTLDPKGLDALLDLPSSAVLAGCGLENTEETARAVERLLTETDAPLVLDADALNVLAGHLAEGQSGPAAWLKALLKERENVALTPHIGEMARLCGKTAKQVAEDMAGCALGLAEEFGCVVALKSHKTLVAAPGGRVYLDTHEPNPGLAKGGSGDVLAGVIASLLAQGLPCEKAAAAGVWLHAEAGLALAGQNSRAGMLPAELPGALCEVWKKLENERIQNDMAQFYPVRRLGLASSLNTRDLGGYPCKGGNTRWGVFLRSDHLRGEIPARDLDYLRSYGVRNTLDLRSVNERERYPSLLESAEGFSGFHVSMNDKMNAVNFEGDLPGSMAGLYIWLLDESQPELAECFRILADAEGASLFHCAVGKDRTGVISMLLLGLVGVAEADIVADYAVTELYMKEWFDKMPPLEGGVEIPEAAIRSLPGSMRRTMEHLGDTYGTAEEYLLGIGVDEARLEAIKKKFVEPSAE